MTAGREAAAEGAAACGPPPVPPGPVALPACCDPLAAAATCCCLRCRPGPPLTKLKSPDMGAFRVPGGGDGSFSRRVSPAKAKKWIARGANSLLSHLAVHVYLLDCFDCRRWPCALKRNHS